MEDPEALESDYSLSHEDEEDEEAVEQQLARLRATHWPALVQVRAQFLALEKKTRRGAEKARAHETCGGAGGEDPEGASLRHQKVVVFLNDLGMTMSRLKEGRHGGNGDDDSATPMGLAELAALERHIETAFAPVMAKIAAASPDTRASLFQENDDEDEDEDEDEAADGKPERPQKASGGGAPGPPLSAPARAAPNGPSSPSRSTWGAPAPYSTVGRAPALFTEL
eukprot:CAMPEP_0194711506 /NCGR_PEP_ID=MMETSP0296-20130528/3790_1 /TAXON_ID=39354 /ORGANISM="Heterosigma akashiwo, Strain CCMP2393" /LENGTH=224 /DNA_ID=CAMNT_0039609555 /DNA_START=339 /DNA_END=1009 /DNA_ORIENTATION=+